MQNDETQRATILRNRASSLNIPNASPKTRKENRKRKMSETSPAELDDPKRIKTEYDELKKVIAALTASVNNNLTKSVDTVREQNETIKEQTGQIPDIRKALQQNQTDIEELKRTIQENKERLDDKIDNVASKYKERLNEGEIRLDDMESCIKSVEELIRTPARMKGIKMGKLLSTGNENQKDLLLRFQLADAVEK